MLKTNKIQKIMVMILGLVLILNLNSCKDSKKAVSLKGVVTFTQGTLKINDKIASVSDIVTEKDVLETDKNSTAIVQFAGSVLVTLKANTKLVVSSLKDGNGQPDQILLTQNQGSTFNKIISGKAKFGVATPTVTAGVRGTAFSILVRKDQSSSIQLLHGSLALTHKTANQPEEFVVTAPSNNDAVKVESYSEKIEPAQKVSAVEKSKLETLDKIEFIAVEKLDTKSLETANAQSILNTDTNLLTELTKEVEDKITLDMLKKRYGSLSKIYTKNKQIYVGNFSQKGTTINIITIDGPVSINASELEKVQPYKN